MKKMLKIVGLFVVGLMAFLVLIFGLFYFKTEAKRHREISTLVNPLPLPQDEAALLEGKRLVQVKACSDCHGTDFGGKVFIDDPAIGRLVGGNLTRGQGSAIFNYSDSDWIRAIRYAVGPDRLPLLGMPAGDFHGISKAELAKMIAYLKSLPPVDRENPANKVGPLAYILSNLGQLPLLFPFEEVDLQAEPVDQVLIATSIEYGKYLSQACTGCHGLGFGGGHIPGTPPEWPDAKNITPKGRMGSWTYEEFKIALTEGKTPGGHQIDPRYMPWQSLASMTETEIKALHLFLKQVPGKNDGTR